MLFCVLRHKHHTMAVVEVLYSTSNWGPFCASERFLAEYNRRRLLVGLHENITFYDVHARHDPIAVQLLKDLGRRASNGPSSNLSLVEIPEKYKLHYKICSLHGEEWVEVDQDASRCACIRQITADPLLSDADKIRQIDSVLSEEKLVQFFPIVDVLPVGPLEEAIPL